MSQVTYEIIRKLFEIYPIILQIVLFLVLLIMTGVVIKIVKKPFMLRWQETIFLSVLNIVGSMIVGISVDLSVVQIEGGVFLLYDDKQDAHTYRHTQINPKYIFLTQNIQPSKYALHCTLINTVCNQIT